jgi:hypothetical protein
MLVLTLYRLLTGGNHVITARRGTLQCINGIRSSLPFFVVLEILRHVVEVVLFFSQRHVNDALSFPD